MLRMSVANDNTKLLELPRNSRVATSFSLEENLWTRIVSQDGTYVLREREIIGDTW